MGFGRQYLRTFLGELLYVSCFSGEPCIGKERFLARVFGTKLYKDLISSELRGRNKHWGFRFPESLLEPHPCCVGMAESKKSAGRRSGPQASSTAAPLKSHACHRQGRGAQLSTPDLALKGVRS